MTDPEVWFEVDGICYVLCGLNDGDFGEVLGRDDPDNPLVAYPTYFRMSDPSQVWPKPPPGIVVHARERRP